MLINKQWDRKSCSQIWINICKDFHSEQNTFAVVIYLYISKVEITVWDLTRQWKRKAVWVRLQLEILDGLEPIKYCSLIVVLLALCSTPYLIGIAKLKILIPSTRSLTTPTRQLNLRIESLSSDRISMVNWINYLILRDHALILLWWFGGHLQSTARIFLYSSRSSCDILHTSCRMNTNNQHNGTKTRRISNNTVKL